MSAASHFPGCHPEDAEDSRKPTGLPVTCGLCKSNRAYQRQLAAAS